MESLESLIETLPAWLQAAALLVAGMSAVAALTPTATDDRAIAALRRLVDFLALNVGHARPAGSGMPARPSGGGGA